MGLSILLLMLLVLLSIVGAGSARIENFFDMKFDPRFHPMWVDLDTLIN